MTHRLHSRRSKLAKAIDALEPRRLMSSGTPDATFNLTGHNSAGVAQHFDDVKGGVLQSDGKVVVVGATSANSVLQTPPSSLLIARFNADGTADTGFGTGGVLTTNVASQTNSVGIGVGQLATGKLLVAGYTEGNAGTKYFLERYNIDGSLDTTFGNSGVVLANAAGLPTAFYLSADGHAYIAAAGGVAGSIIVEKFNSNGTLEPTFGTSGVATGSLAGSSLNVASLALTPSGDIVAAGTSTTAAASGSTDTPQPDFAVVAFTSAGRLGTNFAAGGVFVSDVGGNGSHDEARGIAVQPDGKILVAGETGSTLGALGLARNVILRLNDNGTPDATFATNGKYQSVPSGTRYQVLDAVAVLADGRIVAAGTDGDPGAPGSSTGSFNSNFSAIRLSSSGAPDASFGVNGVSTVDFNGSFDEALAILPGADGRLVLVGNAGNNSDIGGLRDFGVARLTADSTPATAYNAAIFGPGDVLQGQDATFTITLDHAATGAVALPYIVSGGDAVAGVDYSTQGLTGTVSFGIGEQSKTVVIHTLVDATNTAGRSFNVTLTNAPAGVTESPATAAARIIGASQPVELPTLSINSVTVAEPPTGGTGTATFTITLSRVSNVDVHVTYATADVSAIAGLDYTSSTGTATIAAGSTTATVSVPVLADALVETDETFVVNLSGASGATLSSASQGVGTIRDTTTPPPVASIGNISVSEPGPGQSAAATFIVTLSSAPTSPVTIQYATANGTAIAGSDYTAAAGTLTFAAGVTSQVFSVAILNNDLAQADTSFTVNLSAPVNATLGTATATATILNNPPAGGGGGSPMLPTLSISGATIAEPPSGSTVVAQGTFTVTLSAASASPVTVAYRTVDGTATGGADFSATTGTLTIPAGQTTGTILVNILADQLIEPDETFSVALANPTNAVLAIGTATGTITDTMVPIPTASIASATVSEPGSGQTATATFIVSLSFAPTLPVRIQYATANGTAIAGTDYTSTTGTLTIPAGASSGSFSVPILRNEASSANTSFAVSLSGGVNVVLPAPAVATGTILNTAGTNGGTGGTLPTLTIGDVTIAEPAANSTTAATGTFTVTLSAASSSDVTVSYRTVDGTAVEGLDYTSTSGSLTIPAGQTSATFTVSVLADQLTEPAETFTVALANPINAAFGATSTATGTISDTPPVTPPSGLPTLSVTGVSVAEGLANRKLATFTINLSAASASPVSFQYATADATAVAGQDYIAKSGTITIPAGSTSATVNVIVNGDTLTEGTETFSLALSGATNAAIGTASASGVATITDAAFRSVSFSGASKVKTTYHDAAGQLVTISLTGGGTGLLYFSTAAADSENADVISVSGTTAKSKLTVTTAKGVITTVGAIQSAGGLGTITGKGVRLAGDLSVAGSLAGVSLAGIAGTGIPLNAIVTVGAGLASNLSLGAVVDASASLAAPPKAISVLSWTDTGGDADVITAPSFATVSSKGAFNAKLNATAGGVTKFAVAGAITGGGISAAGTVKSITAASVSNATFDALQDLSLTSKGAVTNAIVRAGSRIVSFSATALVNSKLLAGVAAGTTTLPADASAFAGIAPTASIVKASIKSAKGVSGFSDSLIVAPQIGTISLGTVTPGSGAVSEGVAGLTIKSLTYAPAGAAKAVKVANADVTNIASGNFAIRAV